MDNAARIFRLTILLILGIGLIWISSGLTPTSTWITIYSLTWITILHWITLVVGTAAIIIAIYFGISLFDTNNKDGK
jgi:chromate transport protein ChrA